jgi:two-component system, NtrC family, response regulator AtoC
MSSKTSPDELSATTSLFAGGDVGKLLRRHSEPISEMLLSVRHGGGTEVTVLRPDVPVVVGRHPPADLPVPDRSLSRAHARFTLTGAGQITVEDLDSTNGTWLQGARITSVEILPGTELLLGDATALVHQLDWSRAPQPLSLDIGEDHGAPVAQAPAMRSLLEMAERLAASSIPVILHGETGAGKEVIARFLHERGLRAKAPLISVNCAAIPQALVESVLFGHERGAFTGAAQQRKGMFEEAHGGTLFLDEIAELPLPAQAALLRVLETKRITRVGAVREIPVDVRLVAATHRDLNEQIAAGTFRADLFYRLSTMVLEIPPLRERREEIEPLALQFLARTGQDRVRAISPLAMRVLYSYGWPGNVRELRNVVERAVVVARGTTIEPQDLPDRLRHPVAIVPPSPARMLESPDEPMTLRCPQVARAPGELSDADDGQDLRAQLQTIEARKLFEALEATGWNQAEAARRLRLPARTLSNKIRALGLKRPGR